MDKEKYIKKGAYFAVKNEASFKKVYLHVNDGTGMYHPKHYGLYECFTVETQHIYGTEEELLFMLGVVSDLKEELIFDIDSDLIENEVLEEMVKIAKREGIDIQEKSSDKAYDDYYNHSEKFDAGNYFYFFKMGKIYLKSCEKYIGL